MGSPTTKTIPNLIQGVSQQAAEQRRDSQCEAQFDCFNSPKDGVVARNGADFVAFIEGLDIATSYTFETFRGLDEHYLAAISKLTDADPATIRVFNYETGDECAVTVSGSYVGYMNNPALFPPRDWFTVQTVEDTSFIANKVPKPALTADLSSVRPKEAMLFFRAGGYSLTYKVTIVFGGVSYNWTYKTPDNSAPANADYISTNNLSATFYRAMTGSPAPVSSTTGTSGVLTGDAGGSGSGSVSQVASDPGGSTLGALGFNIEINGNLLRIWRNDGQDFLIDTADGVGDTHLTALKDNVRSFSELPKGGFPGYLLRVRGVDNSTRTDFFVEYVNNGQASGFWRERVGPGVAYALDPQLMPHGLVNTGPGTFNFGPLTWSSRIAGDGVDTAKNPGFVGRNITEMFFHKSRLAFLTAATCDWSKAQAPFTMFPDTVQTVLDTDPVNITLASGQQSAILKKALSVDEGLFLWAQMAQFRVNSGQDPFKQSTVDAPEAGAYEFAENCNFAKVGTAVYLASEPDNTVTIRSLQFANGKLQGDIDVTAHVPDYIPAGARRLSVSDTGQLLVAQTDGDPSSLFLYNYLVQDRSVVQSAWNKWRFPQGSIARSSVYRNKLYLAVQRAGGTLFLRMPLNHRTLDPGGAYLTRLDYRVTEAQCVMDLNETTGNTAVVLPYPLEAGELENFRLVLREDGTGGLPYKRGRLLKILGYDSGMLTVEGDVTGYKFYAGFRIDSRRTESTFHLRGPEGTVPVDELTIREYRVSYASTAYTRIEVGQGAGREKQARVSPNIAGTSALPVGSPPVLATGVLDIGVDAGNTEATITLVNDTPYPSRWQTAAYTYEAVLRSKPSRVKAGGA